VREQSGSGEGVLRAAMGGLVRAVDVAPGDAVEAGRSLVTVDAMKLEHAHALKQGGVIGEVFVRVGDQVSAGDVLLRLAVPHQAGQPETNAK